MDLTQQVDGYCERLSPGLWAEPLNAVTNLAFILVGLWMWWRSAGVPAARGLSVILLLIGLGSGVFHTYATQWAGLADVLPILGFILFYIYLMHRDVWRHGIMKSSAFAVGFIPFAAATTPVFTLIPGIGSSAGYMPVPLLIALHAWLLRPAPIARGLAVGAGLLVMSICFRALDLPLCGVLPIGTHFIWHLLNAVMLGWMIAIYRRHMLAAPPAGR
ncbi:MAG: hypothetical protein ACRBBV_02460 [Paracoccaceae bacterium]